MNNRRRNWFRGKKEVGGNAFISTWNTANTSAGSSASNQIKLPLPSGAVYDFIVDWGDGSSDNITDFAQSEVTHTYLSSGTYTITITGICQGWVFGNSGDRLKLTNINQWGTSVIFNSTSNANIGNFYGCANLDISATDIPNLPNEMAGFFRACTSLVGNASFNNWDLSGVTSILSIFNGATNFNQNISNWDVSSISNFSGVFTNSGFNNGGDTGINNWNVSNSVSFGSANIGMFQGNTVFNQPIGLWNTSNCTSLSNMFSGASSFNQYIGDWDVSKVTDFRNTFRSANSFNQYIGDWDVSSGTNFGNQNNQGMFTAATSFNQDIGGWNVSNAIFMRSMFAFATAFNQNLGSWDVSKVSDLTSFMQGKTEANFSAANLDAIYNGWSSLTFVNTGLSVNFGSIKYTSAGQAGRDILTSAPNNWTITDGGI